MKPDERWTRRDIRPDLLKCIRRETPSRIPCFPLGLEFDVRQAA